jgi:hypothetical protein|tara:strand:+ start:466 stop:1023 length:558 start_codon:yes stop_codon:yes gene_type:complete
LIIIKHRVNSIKEINPKFGLEIDIHNYNNKLVLAHDHPNEQSIKLEDFITHIPKNSLLAINIKNEEVEVELKIILSRSKTTNYFTFDWPVTSLRNAINHDLNCAFRLSEYEKDIVPNCPWVWLDSFNGIWYDADFLISLKKSGIKLAIVSPELHNREADISKVKDIVNAVKVDAMCTDIPEFWST